ncbi:MAG: hypothetical protein NTZ10_06005 [Candidatus Saganbacteria bacterium]|nr:hypothetical protein [Candidatus Saganbacteria bacterium]
MEKATLTGAGNIEKVYERLRKIDSIRDGNITREELDEAAKKQIDTSDVIPAIKECDDNNYVSSYNGRNVSVAEFKQAAIEYLEKQKQSKDFIDPFPAKE